MNIAKISDIALDRYFNPEYILSVSNRHNTRLPFNNTGSPILKSRTPQMINIIYSIFNNPSDKLLFVKGENLFRCDGVLKSCYAQEYVLLIEKISSRILSEQSLGKEYKTLFLPKYVEGLSLSEISARTQISTTNTPYKWSKINNFLTKKNSR
jgi:hypothetical protein